MRDLRATLESLGRENTRPGSPLLTGLDTTAIVTLDGGEGYDRRVLFYVGVPNVEAALERAESLGGQRRMGPEGTPGTLVVGQFTDPEGNLIGVAGTA